MNAGVVVYAFVIVPGALIPLTANVSSLWPELRRAGGVDVRIWRVVLAGGFPFLVMTAIQIVYGSIDMVMLRPLAGDATVGWYALAYRWISLPVLLASTCMLAVFPALSVRSLEQDDQFSRLANRALMFVAFIGFPAATGIALVADDIISMTYHGQFRETIPLMQILALSIPIVVIDMVLGMVMFASDRQKQWMILGAVTMFINPAINIFAIPYTVDRYGNGAIGAAIATVVTELVVLGGAIYLVPRWRDGSDHRELRVAVPRGGGDHGVDRPGPRRHSLGRQDRRRCAQLCCGDVALPRRDASRVRVVPGAAQRPLGPTTREFAFVPGLPDSDLNPRGVICPSRTRPRAIACRP